MTPSSTTGLHTREDHALAILEGASLEACITAFTEALAMAHPTLLSRHPLTDREVTAALLLMHLDACRSLLLVYDRLTFGEPIDGFEHATGGGDGEEEDIPF